MIRSDIPLGFNEGTTKFNSTLENDLRDAAAAGFSGIEIRLDKLEAYLTDHTLDDLVARLAHESLAVYPLNAVKNFNAPEEHVRAGALQQFEIACRWAQKIGAPAVVLVPCTTDADHPSVWDNVRQISSHALQSLEAVATSYGIATALEPVGLSGSSIRTVAEAVEVLIAGGKSGSGLLLDTFNVYTDPNWERFSLPAGIPVYGIHVADADNTPRDSLTQNNRLWPGHGVIPLCEMLRMFTVHGYHGPLTVELFRPEYYSLPAAEVVQRSMETLQAVVNQCAE